MADTEQEAKWRKEFEMVGPDTLRFHLVATPASFPTELKRCAEAWILEKEAEKAAIETKRFRKILGWTIAGTLAAFVAALAAIVSAWPQVATWIQRGA
jgi:hypothetical protein